MYIQMPLRYKTVLNKHTKYKAKLNFLRSNLARPDKGYTHVISMVTEC